MISHATDEFLPGDNKDLLNWKKYGIMSFFGFNFTTPVDLTFKWSLITFTTSRNFQPRG